MRFIQVSKFYIAAFCLLASVSQAHAEAAAGTAHPPVSQQERTVIVEDEDAGAFRFIIDGREAARLDSNGLHIRKNLTYGGTMTDVGEAFYEKTLVDRPLRPNAEGGR